MLISYRWLERHVDLSGLSADEVAEALTLHTAEVEGVEPFLPHLSDVTVGHVVEREKHPDADKLSVCRVDVGDGEPLQIVCGAPNVRQGLKVAVATVGTVLPGDFKIKKSKIRGAASVGMICSERELGLGDEHSGIWELADDCEVGAPVARAVGAEDWLIEIDNKSLTHRPDLWGHRGIAREVSATHGRELRPLDVSLPPTGAGEVFGVRIEHEHCSRYIALPIDGVEAQRSPDWMRRLLLAVGQRPIDLLVDVSNFVMLDLGQPNHLFDRTRLREGIVVRKARADESMTTLDGVERKLTTDDLLICDGEEPVALAGVMGGEGTMVEAGTNQLLLEVAAFDPVCVRRTSARLGLRTDASARFEKHLDPTLPAQAAGHLVRLLAELQPGLTLPAPPTDVGDWSDPAHTLRLRPERVRSVLGAPVDDAAIGRMLESVGFGVRPADGELDVDVPSARATKDVTIEEDLIEEVGRLYLYGNIEERPIEGALLPAPRDERRELVERVQDRLAADARFHEAQTYSFLDEALVRAVGAEAEPYVELLNPVADGLGRIRRSVVPSLIGTLPTNLRHRDTVRLFEVGKGYRIEEADDRGQPREVHEVGLVLASPRAADARFDAGSLAALRAVVEDLVRVTRRVGLQWRAMPDASRPSWAHPGRAVVGVTSGPDGSEVEVCGLADLEPGIALELELEGDVACGYVSLDALLAVPGGAPTYRPIPRYPGVKIDVALASPAELPAGEVETAIRQAGRGLVAELELFDLYEGESVGAGKKSLAWHVLLQAPDRTLSDKDVAKFLDRLERGAERSGAELRRE